jgi:hypothetical protein
MTFAYVSFAAFLLGSFGILYTCARNAPEGYEDESGFHFAWRNNRPDVPDVVCIWSCVQGTLASARG